MAFSDLFSDSNERTAKNQLKKGYKSGYRAAKKQYRKGFRKLRNQYSKAIGGIEGAGQVARQDITAGRDQALAGYDPYVKATAGAAPLYADAIGLGGAEGNARAVEAYQTSPGFDFALNQGLQAVERRAAARGDLGGGGTRLATNDYAYGMANQDYGNWLNRLQGQQEFGAGIAGDRANLYTGAAGQMADAGMQTGLRSSAIRTGIGDASNQYRSNLGDLGYSTKLGIAGVKSGFNIGKDATGANQFGAVTGVASLGSKLLGL